MTDLTDSFCERCGARYAFVANAPKGPLKGARVLARGLRNFVLTDGQSIADSLELARHEDDHDSSSRIAEAFHRTFNFCMSCRQYACDRCWNAAAGACLSCSPATVQSQAAHQGPPRTRHQRLEAPALPQAPSTETAPEWSLFGEIATDSTVSGSAQPAPLFDPTFFGDRLPAPQAQQSVPPSWPAIDLPDGSPAATAGAGPKNGKSGKDRHEPNHKQVDAAAAADWPAADTIAPEMTLTPDELKIIEAHLGQPSRKGATAEAAGPTPKVPLLEEMRTWWNSKGSEPDDTADAEWSLDDSATDDLPAGDLEPAAAPSETIEAAAADAAEEPPQASADDSPTLEADLPPVSSKLLRRTSTADALPLLTPAEPTSQPNEPGGLVSRLLGRHSNDGAISPASRGRRETTKRGQVPGEPWPHPTSWSERPQENRHWWMEGETPSSAAAATATDTEVGAAGFDATLTPEPAAELSPEPPPISRGKRRGQPYVRADRGSAVPTDATTADIDSRSAASLRLSAVGSAMAPAAGSEVPFSFADDDPAATELAAEVATDAEAEYATGSDQPSFDLPVAAASRRPAPAREPAWLRVQREAAEPEPDRPHFEGADLPNDQASQTPSPAAPTEPVPAARANDDETTDAPSPVVQFLPMQPEPQSQPEVPAQAASDMPAASPAAPWPPLGASWPSKEKPGAPWATPETTAVPAVVAAGQTPAPTMAEMWVQSAQEVLNRGSVRVCHHCALPVSTKARFCRRCGTQQV